MSGDGVKVRDTRTSSGAPDDPEVARVAEELARRTKALAISSPEVLLYRKAIEQAVTRWEQVAATWQRVAEVARQFSPANGGVEALKAETRAGEALARAAELKGYALLGDSIVSLLRKATTGPET